MQAASIRKVKRISKQPSKVSFFYCFCLGEEIFLANAFALFLTYDVNLRYLIKSADDLVCIFHTDLLPHQ